MEPFDPEHLRRIAPFFLQSEGLEQLIDFSHRDFTPILVTGPAGVGKTALVRFFVTEYLPPRTEVEWVDLQTSNSPIGTIDGTLMHLSGRLRFPERPQGNRLVVVLDGVEALTKKQLEETFSRLYNRKVIRNVIAISRKKFDIRRAKTITISVPDLPSGKLYGLREQTPERKIISLVAPRILNVNDSLILKLKRRPGELYEISPRQFEEVIADLLTDMGMEVELTPATRDGGKDILAYMKTEIGKFLCLVEAKQHNRQRPVGVGLVRSLFGTLVDHKATSGMLVTTSRFAKPAQEFQERHKYQLSLKDYGDVVSWILQYKET